MIIYSSTNTSPRPGAHVAVECPDCNSIGYRNDRYCACCGKPVVRRCTACKAEVTHPVAHYCSNCGVSLAEEG